MLGADDYDENPARELVSRINVVLRRHHRASPSRSAHAVLCVGPLRMDVDDHTFEIGGVDVGLSITEFALMQGLMRNPDGYAATRNFGNISLQAMFTR